MLACAQPIVETIISLKGPPMQALSSSIVCVTLVSPLCA